MKLELSNVGKIYKKTTINFDGITILAGENGVGKSTIGKALFCIFDSFHNLEEKISQERIDSISILLRSYSIGDKFRSRSYYTDMAKRIVENYSRNDSIEEIKNVLLQSSILVEDEESFNDFISKAEQRLKIEDSYIEKQIVKERLNAELGGEISNVNYEKTDSEINLFIKDHHIGCRITDGDIEIDKNIELLKAATYIGDSNVIDYMTDEIIYSGKYSHNADLYRKLYVKKRQRKSIIDDVILDGRLEDIVEKMNDVGIGDITWENEKGWVYRHSDLKGSLGIENLSSGLKGFIQLKQLIKNGCLEEKGVLILDEPEIHLHPKWQKVFAEIIVRLQIEFHLTVLISTHSTDFLSFVEYYVKTFKLEKYCNYYLVKGDDNGTTSSVVNVTGETDSIYKELSMPYLNVVEMMNGEE